MPRHYDQHIRELVVSQIHPLKAAVSLELPTLLVVLILHGALVVLMTALDPFGMDPLSFALTAFTGANAVFGVLTFHEIFDPVWHYLYLMELAAEARGRSDSVEEAGAENPFRPTIRLEDVLRLETDIERLAEVILFSSSYDIRRISAWCSLPGILSRVAAAHRIKLDMMTNTYCADMILYGFLQEIEDEDGGVDQGSDDSECLSILDTIKDVDDLESAYSSIEILKY